MKKTLYLLNINNYSPELKALTYPYIARYAERIGARICLITERKFPSWDLDYEKLQIFEMAQAEKNPLDPNWHFYIDSDALMHPDFPDLFEFLKPDHAYHNGTDFAPIRWTYDEYFRRDGRHIGSCCWIMICSDWTLDMVKPLEDMTYQDCLKNIRLTHDEKMSGVLTPGHLVTDYAVSRNIAKYGLKCDTLNRILNGAGNFFWHEYTIPLAQKIENVRNKIAEWKI